MRFVIAGTDLPALYAINLLLDTAPQSLAAILTAAPRRTLPERLAAHPEIRIDDSRLFKAEDAPARLAALGADWLICANCKVYLPPSILEVFAGRVMNVHPGLLPRQAGMYAYQWAIRNGETQTGATIHWVEEGVDTGDIITQRAIPILSQDTGRRVQRKVLLAGARQLRQVLLQILAGQPLAHRPQDFAGRSFHSPEAARDGRIDWRWSARQVIDFIRAGNFSPRPSPSYTATLDCVAGFRIEVLRAMIIDRAGGTPGQWLELTSSGPVISCGNGQAVCLTQAQSGAERMTLPWWQIYRNQLPGDCLAGRREP